MAGPWERYQQQAPAGDSGSKPWEKAAASTEQEPSMLGKVAGYADNLVRLLARGATFGAADNLAAGASALTGIGGAPTVEGQQAQTAQAREDTGLVGTAAELAGGIVPGLAIPGAAFSSVGRAAATGGAMGLGATEATSYFDTGELAPPEQAVIGTIMGAGLGAGGAAFGKLMQQPAVSAARQKSIEVLNKAGINVSKGQATGSKALLKREAAADGATDFIEEQTRAFSKAALAKANIVESADGALSPEALMSGFKRVGQEMDGLVARNNIAGPEGRKVFPELYREVYTTARRYHESIEGPAAKIVQNTVKNIGKAMKRGSLSGEEYQSMTSSLEAAARSNTNLAPTLREIRGHIDEAMGKYIQATNPADAGLWQMSRRRYRDLLVVEDAFSRATGRVGNERLIAPKDLKAAVKSVSGKRAYRLGEDTLGELADAGIDALPSLPVGNYAAPHEMARILAKSLATRAIPGMSVGGGVGFAAGGPLGAAVGAGAGLLGSRAADALLRPTIRPFNVSSQPPINSVAALGRGGAMAGQAAVNNPFTNLLKDE